MEGAGQHLATGLTVATMKSTAYKIVINPSHHCSGGLTEEGSSQPKKGVLENLTGVSSNNHSPLEGIQQPLALSIYNVIFTFSLCLPGSM